MTALTTSRMDDSYVEEAERENGRPVSRIGVEPQERRGPGLKADDAVPRERLADLLPRLLRHDELDLETLAYHLQQSDATAADGYCHAAINEARSFLEALVVNIVRAGIRVAGEVALPRLPHHRTYGSVYGGSRAAREASILLHQADEAQPAQLRGRDGAVHVAGPGIVPGAAAIPRRPSGPLMIQAPTAQLLELGPVPLPLSPHNATQLPP